MNLPIRCALTLTALAVMAPASHATTRSSFLNASSISGVTAVTSNAGRSYTISLSASPSFSYHSDAYSITDLIGFYVLSDDNDFSPLPSLSTIGGFSNDSTNSGTGAVAGWRSNPNSGLTPGHSLTFTLPSNFPIASIDRIGFHVRVECEFPNTSGNTGNITGPTDAQPPGPSVPAPGAYALLGVGLLALARRRRRA
jgi:MYXO-CTERM domain-containing protein